MARPVDMAVHLMVGSMPGNPHKAVLTLTGAARAVSGSSIERDDVDGVREVNLTGTEVVNHYIHVRRGTRSVIQVPRHAWKAALLGRVVSILRQRVRASPSSWRRRSSRE